MIILRWSGKAWTCHHNGRTRRLHGVAHGARSELIAARYRCVVDPDEDRIIIARHQGMVDGLTGKLIGKRWASTLPE